MKTKKAVKKLKKAQLSISAVVDQWGDLDSNAREILKTAGESVHRALALIDVKTTSTTTEPASNRAGKGRAKSAKRQPRISFSEERRRRLSLAAKRRWAAAKRRGAKSLAG